VCAAEGEAIVPEAAVYGDWLLAQGDARGHVASGALSLDAASDDEERTRRAAALAEIVTEHAGHLFGPARSLFDQHCMQLEWIGPMIASAKLTEVSGSEFDHLLMLERLLGLPVCAGLRTLVLQSRFTEHHELGDLIAHSRCASSLRSLSLFGGPRVSFADARFERLEQLELFTTEVGIGALSAPSLRRFVLELRFPLGQLPVNLARFDAPALEHFEFGTMTYDYWEQHEGPLHRMLGVVFEQPVFARLRSLTLRSLPSSLPYGAGLAQMLARLPARHTLERIDLREANLAPEARAELDAVRGGPQLLLP
jgi:hypothetical protein